MISKTTEIRYTREWKKWLNYCDENRCHPLPCAIRPLYDYIRSLPSYPVVEIVMGAINYFHTKAGYGKPCRHPKIKALVKHIFVNSPHDKTNRSFVYSVGRYGKRLTKTEYKRRRDEWLQEMENAKQAFRPRKTA